VLYEQDICPFVSLRAALLLGTPASDE